MKVEVEAWIAFAKQTEGIIQQAVYGFEALSASYEPMRDIGYADDEKEAIDQSYSAVNNARANLAALQAGGGKRRRKTRKQRK